jgi:hypothetical protein
VRLHDRAPRAPTAQQLVEVLHDDVGAARGEGRRARGPTRSTPDDDAEGTRPPGLHAGQRVLEDGGLGGLHPEQGGPGEERVGGRLAGRPRSRATSPSTRASNRSVMPGDPQHVDGVRARAHHRGAQARLPRRVT